MATKIRLQRRGRKSYAFYSIVIADVRAPRDGKFTEKIGTYNPNTNPATVDLKFDRALYWVEAGAQPTDTVRNILSNEGVYLMKHLRGGVRRVLLMRLPLRLNSRLGRATSRRGSRLSKQRRLLTLKLLLLLVWTLRRKLMKRSLRK